MLFKTKPSAKKAENKAPDRVIPVQIASVPVRVSQRARRMALRVDAKTGDVFLSWPLPARRLSAAAAEKFIIENKRWIDRQLAKKAAIAVIGAGSRIDILGQGYTIVHAPGRGVTRFEGDSIVVQGQSEFLQRRLRDFLKKHALDVLAARARDKQLLLKLKPARLRVIDPKSRWGSCAPDGTLMFSWRIILAPDHVLDYLVAHEVAHRVHMNHGAKFWALCDSLCAEGENARAWLKFHGPRLMAML